MQITWIPLKEWTTTGTNQHEIAWIVCNKQNTMLQNQLPNTKYFFFLVLVFVTLDGNKREIRTGISWNWFSYKKNCNNERRNKMIFYISTSSNDLNTNTPNLKFCQLRKRKYKFLEKNIVNERKKSSKEEKKWNKKNFIRMSKSRHKDYSINTIFNLCSDCALCIWEWLIAYM